MALTERILVADGGSTKAEWLVIEGRRDVAQFETEGCNPLQMTAQEIENVWRRGFERLRDVEIDAVYYYGAGCTGGEPNERIREAIMGLTKCLNISVFTDMLGVARATLGDGAGCACILGTGANSCLYDGREICGNVRPLGYILGDEGSGADIGKHIVADALKGLFSKELTEAFYDYAAVPYPIIIQNIYSRPRANAYLASFTRFAVAHIECVEIQDIVRSRFEAFLQRNVLLYEAEAMGGKVSFAGGVANAFREILTEVCENHGLTVRDIEERPLKKLAEYHKKKQ